MKKPDLGGRRPADPKNRRTCTVPVKLSEGELRACREAADEAGKAFSEWAREAMLREARA